MANQDRAPEVERLAALLGEFFTAEAEPYLRLVAQRLVRTRGVTLVPVPIPTEPSAAAIEAAYAVSERREGEPRTEPLLRALRAAYAIDIRPAQAGTSREAPQ